MRYNDNLQANARNQANIRHDFAKILEHETHDLQEIYDKLNEQYQNISQNNLDHTHDEILSKIENNLKDLQSIIDGNRQSLSTKSDTIPEIQNVRINPPLNRESVTPTTLKRKSPTPSNFFGNIFAKFSLNSRGIKSSTQKSTNPPQNRFHNTEHLCLEATPYTLKFHNGIHTADNSIQNYPHDHDCNSWSHIRHNQSDILRLLLLYLMLRPNCKYISRLSHIAYDELDIMLALDR